jgi:hypothetical protein
MAQSIEIEAPPVLPKKEILEKVIDIFIENIGWIERHEISKDTNFAEDFKIDHDDISLFLVMVLRHFGMPKMVSVDCSPTIEGVSNFVFDFLANGRTYDDPRDKQGLWGRFLKWIAL